MSATMADRTDLPWDPETQRPDVAILVALKEEMRELLELTEGLRSWRGDDRTGEDYVCVAPNERGRAYRVVVYYMGDMGPPAGVQGANRLLALGPALIVSLGIACSLDDKDLRLSDVIVANQIDGYDEKSKANDDGKDDWEWSWGGEVYRGDDDVTRMADQFELSERPAFQAWAEECERERLALLDGSSSDNDEIEALIRDRKLRRRPHVVKAHLASGVTVAAAKAFRNQVLKRDRNIKALEMEAVGVARAAFERRRSVPTLVLRGISDLGDGDKKKLDAIGDGALRKAAMRNATRLLWALMKTGRLPQVEDGPGREGPGSGSDASPSERVDQTRATPGFVGRTTELRALEKALLEHDRPVAVTAVYGMPGVGKSYLADRFALVHADRFPGGARRIALGEDDPRTDAQILLELADALGVKVGQLRARLRDPRTLLHIENADSPATVSLAHAVVTALPKCPVIVTGRVQDLGRAAGWAQVRVDVLDEPTAVALLRETAKWPPERRDDDLRRVAAAVGYLPLALGLLGGHLRHGASVDYVLAELERTRLRLEPKDPTALRPDERARGILRSSFEITWRLLEQRLGDDAAKMLAGVTRLGHAPATGFGRSLGAAMAGLDDYAFDRLMSEAYGLSLVQFGRAERDRWMFHPLIAEFLRGRSDGEAAALDGMTAWFEPRLRLYQQREAVKGVFDEQDALKHWLARVPAKDRVIVERAGSKFAIQNGPFGAWRSFCANLAETCEADEHRSNALWTLANVARRAGDIELARKSATAKAVLDEHRGDEREAVLAFSVLGDILYDRGELEQALRIRQDKELPAYQRLGNERSEAVTWGKIGDILYLQGRLEDALEIRHGKELPVYQRLGDVREEAITWGKIGDILHSQGKLDAALRIRQEEQLPVYQRLGNVREEAITWGQIGDILHDRGELEEALKIRQEKQLPVYQRLEDVYAEAATWGKIGNILAERGELEEALKIRQNKELPVYQRLGNRRGLVIANTMIGQILVLRNTPGDRERAAELFRAALREAEAMGIPEAAQIRAIMKSANLE